MSNPNPPTVTAPAAGSAKQDGARGPEHQGADAPARKSRSRRRDVLLTISVVWVVVLTLSAVFANFIPGLPHYSTQVGEFAQAPNLSSLAELLGTDSIGRSNLSRIIFGARISLTIAICSTVIGLGVGLVLGMLAGYYRGTPEAGATILANTVASLPPLILLLALVAAIGTNIVGITIALGIVISDFYIRIVKGAVIGNVNREYVIVARALGAKDTRIMLREILPNLIPVVAAVVPMAMAIMIIVEGSLSFLGYGIPPPNPSWGGMIAAGTDVARNSPHVVMGPVLTLFLTIFAFNTIGDHLGSRTDVREGQL